MDGDSSMLISTNLVSFHTDLLHEVISDLCYVDAMAFRWTCKRMNVLSQPSFKDIFLARLYPLLNLDPNKTIVDFFPFEEDFDTSIDNLKREMLKGHDEGTIDYFQVGNMMRKHRYHLCQMIKETQSIIAGSFILDCLYNTNYHNDIDLYAHPYSSMRKFLTMSGFFHYNGETPPEETQTILHGIETLSLKETNHNEIIQYIPVALRKVFPSRTSCDVGWKRPPKQFGSLQTIINRSYDLDICKSCFDGEKLYVRSWKKLFGRYDYIKCNMRFVTRFYRDDGDDDDVEGIDLEITEIRAKKYRSRGFRIEPHPQNNLIIEMVTNVMENGKLGIEAIEQGLINLDRFFLE